MNISVARAGEEFEHALLIVYSDIEGQNGPVSAANVYKMLMARNLWFTPRLPRKPVTIGMPCLFYESGSGFRGAATLNGVDKTSVQDQSAFSSIPLRMYPYKLLLSAVRSFDTPLDPRPILNDLSFVSNKIYWGHSFRFSPRLITIQDYNRVLYSAHEGAPL